MKGKLREGRDKLRVASPTRNPQGEVGAAGGSTSNLDQNLLEGDQYEKPGIVEPYVTGSGLAQMVRGKSFEVSRGQTYQGHIRASQDVARTDFAPTGASASASAAPPTIERIEPKKEI